MRKLLGILLILALIAGIFVSCSQDKVGSMVDEDLVSVSFSSEGVSRALTVSREPFNENNYVWYYKSAKADSTGLKQGEKDTWTPVKPTTGTRTGLSGARITGLSQGLWDFELQAYVYNTGDAQDKDYANSGVAAWYGKVTNQSVRKDAANIVYVTVSAISSGTGTIDWHGISGMQKLDEQNTLSFAQIVTAGMKVYVSATKVGATAAAADFTIDSDTIEGMTGLFPAVPYGTYLFNMKVFSGTDIAHADYIYADETIAVNVYSGLKTIITGFISELSSYVEFGEPVANAVIEAETPNIAEQAVTQDVAFTNTQTEESTSFSTAVIKAKAANDIRNAVIAAATAAGNTVSDLSLALNVEDKGSTDATSGTTTTTTKSFDISLTQIVTQTNDSTGVSTVTSSNVENVSKHLVIDLNVGAGLQNFKAYHNVGGVDKLMGEVSSDVLPEPGSAGYNAFGYFWYKSSSGVVTLFVDSFSPFSVTYDTKDPVARVIKVNGTGADYYSLKEAIDAANDGDTVKLLRDISTTETILINKDITVDGNDMTITVAASVDYGIAIESMQGLDPAAAHELITPELKNITVDARNSNGAAIYTEGLFLHAFLTDVTVYGKGGGITVCGAYDGTNKKLYESFATLVNVKATTYGNRDAEWRNYAISSQTFGTLVLSEGTSGDTVINATETTAAGSRAIGTMSSPSRILVKDGTINGKIVAHDSSDYADFTCYEYDPETKMYVATANKTTISIIGGSINGELELQNSRDEIVITGGTFDHDPTAYVADGYYAELNPTTSMYTVKQYEARIGETYKETLKKAWKDAGAADTIVLLKDLNQDYYEAYSKKTLDLNGHTLTLNGHEDAGTTGGAIYIDGGGNGGHGELTITNGTLNMPGTRFSTYGIYNYGTMTLEDVVINSACDTVIYVNGQSWGTAGSTTLDDVTINSTKASSTAFAAYALKNWSGTIAPTVSIKDSEITGINNAVMIYACPATIDGCTITATNNDALWISNSSMGSGVYGTVTVKGNTSIVAGSDYKRLNAAIGHKIEVIEGIYNFDPSNNNNKNFVPEGYQVVDNGDGTWTVTKLPSEDEQVLITKSGETDQQMSLAAFSNSVNAGNTYKDYLVTLRCDVTTASNWTPIGASGSFSGTFDGGKHTITLNNVGNTSAQEIALFGVVNNGGTIKNLTVAGSVTANKKAAGVIYKLENGSVIDVTNKATVTVEQDKAGGIVANSYGSNSFTRCRNEGAITINNLPSASTNNVAGGIVAYMGNVLSTGSQVFTDCVNTGIVSSANGGGYVAGMVGYASGGEASTGALGTIRFDGCINVGTISGSSLAGMLAFAHASSSPMTVILDDCVDLKGYTLCVSTGSSGHYGIDGTLVVLSGTANVITHPENSHAEDLSGLPQQPTVDTYVYEAHNYNVDKYIIQ